MNKLTQQQKILQLLKENKSINSHDLTYIYGIKQGPTRISELKELGHNIETSALNKNKSVDYSLPNYKEEKKLVRYEFKGNVAIPIYE